MSSISESVVVQRFCQYSLIKISSKFPFPGMTGCHFGINARCVDCLVTLSLVDSSDAVQISVTLLTKLVNIFSPYQVSSWLLSRECR